MKPLRDLLVWKLLVQTPRPVVLGLEGMEMNLRPENNLSIQLIEPQDPELISYTPSPDGKHLMLLWKRIML